MKFVVLNRHQTILAFRTPETHSTGYMKREGRRWMHEKRNTVIKIETKKKRKRKRLG